MTIKGLTINRSHQSQFLETVESMLCSASIGRTKRHSKNNCTSSKLVNHRALSNSLATLRGNKPTHIRSMETFRIKVKSGESQFAVMVSSVSAPPLVNHASLCLFFFNSLIPLHVIKGRKSSEDLLTVKYQIKSLFSRARLQTNNKRF